LVPITVACALSTVTSNTKGSLVNFDFDTKQFSLKRTSLISENIPNLPRYDMTSRRKRIPLTQFNYCYFIIIIVFRVIIITIDILTLCR